MNLLRNKLVILGIGLGVAVLAWFGMTSSGPVPLLTSDTPANAAGQELVETLLQLRAVKLDGTIFNEPAFMSLQDYSQPIIQEPVGRENPFAPLDAGAPNNNPNAANAAAAGAAQGTNNTPPARR
jgi:hypothetical protein